MLTFEQIRQTLNMLSNPEDKLEFVMDLGKQLRQPDDTCECVDIIGCSSRVIICYKDNIFFAKADSQLVAGIVAILISMVQNKTHKQIKDMNLRQTFKGLHLEFGASRLNGINSMINFFENL